eukprot:UN04726
MMQSCVALISSHVNVKIWFLNSGFKTFYISIFSVLKYKKPGRMFFR